MPSPLHVHRFSFFQTQLRLLLFDFQPVFLGVESYFVWGKFQWMGHLAALLLHGEHMHDNN